MSSEPRSLKARPASPAPCASVLRDLEERRAGVCGGCHYEDGSTICRHNDQATPTVQPEPLRAPGGGLAGR